MLSALAPYWQYQTIQELGFEPLVLDVTEYNAMPSIEIISEGIKAGGVLLILHETEGILPDFAAIQNLGIPFIEDISQSAGASVAELDENGVVSDKRRLAGSFGIFTILGLEERNVITAGGGSILYASGRRDWIVLKKYVDLAPVTDLLPDINSALAWVQIKEYNRNENTRKELFSLYQHACMIGKHKTFSREMDNGSTMCSFPLILASSFKDVKQYAAKKDIEIRLAFENSIVANQESVSDTCIKAKSLFLRCIHVPLYPRLTKSESAKIVKVLGTLP